jgi:hypothetical protein
LPEGQTLALGGDSLPIGLELRGKDRLNARSMLITRFRKIGARLMTIRSCPCCSQSVREPPSEGSADLTDARPGDQWCEFCHWLIMREVEDPMTLIECPTHGPLYRRSEDQSGA